MTSRHEVNALMGNPVSIDDTHGPDPITTVMEAKGLTNERLVDALLEEMEATDVKLLKVKAGNLRTAPGLRVVAETGVQLGAGAPLLDAESVLQVTTIDWGTRQKARMDAHKLKNQYPNAKQDLNVTGDGTLLGQVLQEIDGNDRGQLPINPST